MASTVKQRVAAVLLTLSAGGLALISSHEGREYKAYRDTTGTWTICDGHTRGVKAGDTANDRICDALLREDSAQAQAAVKRLVKVPITQEQYNALTDFVFNKGEGNFASSTLLRKVNANDCWGAGAEFPKWNKSKGVVLRGLVRRAADNRSQWESGCDPRP